MVNVVQGSLDSCPPVLGRDSSVTGLSVSFDTITPNPINGGFSEVIFRVEFEILSVNCPLHDH